MRLLGWAVDIGGLTGYYCAVVPGIYSDATARQGRAALMRGPAGALLTGPGYGVDDYRLGPMMANEMLGLLAVAAALMSLFLVVRHTRADEETGRAELLRAGMVGRYAPLTAALLTALVADGAVSAALFAALISNRLPPTDSLAMAVSVGAVGVVFAAAAAVTAQLGEHARTASGLAGAALGLTYLARGVGDGRRPGGSAVSWTSPIGWAQQTRPFVDVRWWPLLYSATLTAALIAVAYALLRHRDLSAGLLPARTGPADARPSLLSPVGLTARLERGSVLAWSAGLFVFAVLTGSMGQGVVESVAKQPRLAPLFGGAGGDVLRSALAVFLGFFAMVVAVFAVVSVNRLRREEDQGRTAAVLATGVSRSAWLRSSLVVTALGSAALLVLSGLGLGVGAASSVKSSALIGELAVAGLAYLPLVLCFAGLAALAHGVHSGTWWVWAVLVSSVLVGLYGTVLGLPQAVLDVAPFGLVPAVPSEAPDAVPLIAMSLVAIALAVLGTAAYRRRDLTG
jgi:ABC-2 type transport system permease protein